MSHPGCEYSEKVDVDRWEDGGGLVLGGEEVAGEELRLHGGLLQPGASINICFLCLQIICPHPRLALSWMRLPECTCLEYPVKIKIRDSQLEPLLALSSLSSSFFFLFWGFSCS